MNTKTTNWHNLKTKEALNILKSSKTGLSTEEAKKRLKKFGCLLAVQYQCFNR